MTAHIEIKPTRNSENTAQRSPRDDQASLEDLPCRAPHETSQESEALAPTSQSAESPLDGADGPDFDGSVTVEDHSTDSSMELAIGSNFDCRSRLSDDGKFDQVDMDARALLKSSVVHLMEGIQRASAKVIKRRRSRTRLAVRVKTESESKARLWAVLDLSKLSDSEREQMRDLAAGVTSEMYAPTKSQTIAEFMSRAKSIEQAHADIADPNAASPQATESATTAKRHALEKAAEELLPTHMQRVVISCSAKADANLVAKTLQSVVDNGRVLCKSLSKSRQEWKGLELKFGAESLVKERELPSIEPVTQTTETLHLQEAWVTAVDYFERVITLRLLADDRKVYVRYKDADHGHAIGEALVAAHLANQKKPEEVGGGVRFARIKVAGTRQIPGDHKFVASSVIALEVP